MEGLKPVLVVFCGLVACMLAACGEADEGGKVADTFETMLQAVEAREAGTVCGSLGPKARRQVREIGHGWPVSCEEGMEPLLRVLGNRRSADGAIAPTVTKVAVEMSAVATIAVDGRTVRVPFVVEDGRWKLDSFYGLSPTPTVAVP